MTTIMEDDPMLHADEEVFVAEPGPPEGGAMSDRARTINISLTGVLVAVPFAGAPGEKLELRFPLDHGEAMAATATIVRVDARSEAAVGEWLLGCQFVALPVEERCRLAKFLMRRRKAVIDAHDRGHRPRVAIPD